MASHSSKIAFIALMIAIAVPASTADNGRWRSSEQDTEQYVRDLCSRTNRTDDCWKILKPELNRFNSSDDRAALGATIDLAIAKSGQIHDRLNKLYTDSRNEELKEKYIMCSKNYNDVNRDLVVARSVVNSKDKRNILVQVKDAVQELNGCRLRFGEDSFDLDRDNEDGPVGKEVFDPAHIRDRNKELSLYLEIVSTALKLIK